MLEVDLDRERISLSLKATQQDPWQEFATNHRVGELVYGRVTKLVPFGAFVQVGDGIEGLVHISEMSAHHVDLPEQVVTPGEELWVKIIDLDLQRRRISLSIKQAAEGGVVAAEYQEHFGEHAYDDEGNYIGTDTTEAQEAWAEYYGEARPRRSDARRRRRRRRGSRSRRRSRPPPRPSRRVVEAAGGRGEAEAAPRPPPSRATEPSPGRGPAEAARSDQPGQSLVAFRRSGERPIRRRSGGSRSARVSRGLTCPAADFPRFSVNRRGGADRMR